MRWGDKRYHSLDYELKKIFGEKVLKLSLNGNFTCPNRDGTIGTKGCLFCSEKGSGEFAAPAKLSISEQIQQQKKFLSKKWTANKYIAYFQSFTNTYAPVQQLKQKYKEALSSPDIVGLAIATRPDCLPEETLNLLEELNQITYLWIELGLQTIHEQTAKLIRRGYDIACFENAIAELKKRNIPVAAHLIFGLPYETEQDMLASVQYIAATGIQGIKIHLLHILKDTDLYRFYQEHPFPLLTQEKYISLIVNALEILPPEMVIHRLTGDGAQDLLFAPKWSINKKAVLNGIQHELKKRNTYQGIRYPQQR
ncbi:MAG TPA: TIGR01212 family radical SAM protein [Clostridiales bacterium]|nr:TIGR01212 family radical SAM protein [Clostridiales bacterium]